MDKKVQFSFKLIWELLHSRTLREEKAGRRWVVVQSIHLITNPTSSMDEEKQPFFIYPVFCLLWRHHPMYLIFVEKSNSISSLTSSSDSKELACNLGDLGSIPESKRSPGEVSGYPLQYSCLQNSMDRGATVAGYSPWDHKVRHDWLNTFTFFQQSVGNLRLCHQRALIQHSDSGSTKSAFHTRHSAPTPASLPPLWRGIHMGWKKRTARRPHFKLPRKSKYGVKIRPKM